MTRPSLSAYWEWKKRRLRMTPADTYPTPTLDFAPALTPGTTVPFTGTGFLAPWGAQSITRVRINSTSVTFTVIDATHATLDVPADLLTTNPYALVSYVLIVDGLGGEASVGSEFVPAQVFGNHLIHLWGRYEGGVWIDVIAGLNGGIGAFGLPAQGAADGHTYPFFTDANNDGMLTVASTMLSGLSSWTIFFLFKSTSVNFYDAAITKAGQFYVEDDGATNRPAYFNAAVGGLVATSSIADGNWHRVIVTADNNDGEIYVDGVLEASGTVDTMPSVNAAVYLGSAPSPFGSCDGSIAIIGVGTIGIGASTLGDVPAIDDYLANYFATTTGTFRVLQQNGSGILAAPGSYLRKE